MITTPPSRSSLPRALALLTLAGLGTVALADVIENQWADDQAPADTLNYGGGWARGAGDFNGDGYDDRIYSHGPVHPNTDVGIQWGGPGGLASTDVTDGGRSVRAATGVGDLNGDGFDDVVGQFGPAGGSLYETGGPGSTRVLFGSASGIDWSQVDTTASPTFTGMSATVFNDAAVVSEFGSGDFNGDGFLDLVIPSKVGFLWATGQKAWIWYGKSDGSGPDLSTASTIQPSDRNIESTRSDFGGRPGTLASGDFNDDGYEDLAVGAYVANYAGYPDTSAGSVYVYYGSATGLTQASEVELQGNTPQRGDFYGWAVASGDVTGDGIDDVVATSRMVGSSSTTCNYITIHEGSAGGTFSNGNHTELEYCASGIAMVAVVDVTDDGIQDILVTTGGGPLIIPGSGSGITLADAYLTCGSGIVYAGDFDGNGADDFVSVSGTQWLNGEGSVDADCDGIAEVTDSDGDGVLDPDDAFPNDPSESADTDGDGVGDNADAFPNDSSETVDTDGDGVGDNADAFPGDSSESADSDGDGVGDNTDAFPFDGSETVDTDGDGVGDVGDICPLDATDDTDLDGVCDSDDVCPGYDDGVDGDGDGTADGCDACPVDYFNDSDGDGLCDSADFCPLDALNDADLDGLCAEVDACPNDPDNDIDYDGVCGDLDICPNDGANDADGDGVCGDVDTCAGGDDSLDADADGTADFCDMCPNDAENDADMDGLCADVDICPADGDNDLDNDGVCGDVDWCPADYYDDSDGDAVCDSDDPCPDDVENDADGDGFCESSDNCPAIANASQDDADGDTIGDACEPDDDGDGVIDDNDNCPMDANLDQADADADGAGDICDADADGDSVMDGEDACLGTPVGEPVLDNGCSVAEACPCDGNWKNHGAYEKCVSHALKDLRKSGVVTGSEARDIRDASEGNECGKTGRGRGHHDQGHSHNYDDESSHDCDDRGHRHDKRRHR
jgi:hypothetical protein